MVVLPPPPAAGSPEALARGRKAAETRAANRERAPQRGKSHHKKPAARPPSSSAVPASAQEQAPLRGPGRVSAAAARNVKSLLVLTIAGGDMVAARLAPKVWTAEDRIQPDETTLLVKAIYAELESAPKVLEFLAAIAEQGVHGQLVYALAMVALPRLMRRGMVPPDVAALLFLAASQPQPPEQPEPDAVSVATGPARQPDWDDGYGQVDTSSPAPVGTPIHNGVSQQAG